MKIPGKLESSFRLSDVQLAYWIRSQHAIFPYETHDSIIWFNSLCWWITKKHGSSTSNSQQSVYPCSVAKCVRGAPLFAFALDGITCLHCAILYVTTLYVVCEVIINRAASHITTPRSTSCIGHEAWGHEGLTRENLDGGLVYESYMQQTRKRLNR